MSTYKKIQKFHFQLFRDLTSLGSLVFFALVGLFALAFQEQLLFWKMVFGGVFSLGITVLIRTFYFKNRPNQQNHTNFIERIDASSFPSLHTGRTIFLALLFINFFKDNYVTIFLIIFAILVAYSRIYLKKHDWYDLMGGLVLGVVTYLLSSLF